MGTIHTFGPFRLQADAEILFRGSEPLPVGRRAVALLRVLVERSGEPVSKDALIEAAWAGLAVEESNLTVQIAALRKVLGEEPEGDEWIETLPRRGYRYIGPTPSKSEVEVPAAATPLRSRALRVSSAEDLAPYRPWLAVMPFRTLQKKDESDDYFAQGMIDDIIRILAGLKDLFVIARSSTLPFAGTPVDPRLVGQELEVRYLLHGSVRRSGEQLRVAAELCETWTGRVLWADRFDGGIYDLFDMQDQLALRVVTSILPHLRRRELILSRRKHPENMTAYDLTLQALDLIHRLDRGSFAEARKLLERAIIHDPNYGPAHSYFAFMQMNWVGQGFSEDETTNNAMAENAAASAIERDDNDALALAIYGHLQSRVLKDYRTGRDYLDRALLAGPSCPWAWGYSGLNWMFLGDYSTALKHSEQAVRLSPIGPDAFWFEAYLSRIYYANEQFEKAVSWGRQSTTGSRNYGSNLRCLIASLVALGDLQEARMLAQQLMQLAPSFRLKTLRATTPLHGEMLEVTLGRLRQAGVPE